MFIPMTLSKFKDIHMGVANFPLIHSNQHFAGGRFDTKPSLGRRRLIGLYLWVSDEPITIHNDTLMTFPRFGLLHRIPPQPEDRIPGSIPPELQEEDEGEYEQHQLFVPADSEDQNSWQHHEATTYHQPVARPAQPIRVPLPS